MTHHDSIIRTNKHKRKRMQCEPHLQARPKATSSPELNFFCLKSAAAFRAASPAPATSSTYARNRIKKARSEEMLLFQQPFASAKHTSKWNWTWLAQLDCACWDDDVAPLHGTRRRRTILEDPAFLGASHELDA